MMKPQYQFIFDNLTIGDAVNIIGAAQQNNLSAFFALVDRYTIGGALDLPFAELPNVAQQFGEAFKAHVERSGEPVSPEVMRLLKQALGGGDG